MASHKPHKAGGYWIYGLHAVTAALANPTRRVHEVLATGNALARLGKVSVPVREAPPAEFDRLLPRDAVHQGMAARVDPLPAADLQEVLATARPVVVLDQVTDPHNVGAILRSAVAFDAGAVIVTRDHGPAESAVMAKAASGALDIVPLVYVGNLASALKEIKHGGYWAAGLDGQAMQTIGEAKLDARTALVLGAEGRGLRRLTAETCDLLVRLPMSDRMESLNVSNAAAIALYELFRR